MLSVPADVAFHTESGGIFQPHHCLGERPAICHTGPIYDRSTFHCVRGILTSEGDIGSHCRVTMAKYVTQGERVVTWGIYYCDTRRGVFIIMFWRGWKNDWSSPWVYTIFCYAPTVGCTAMDR